MDYKNVLDIENREDFRDWLSGHSTTETECWVAIKPGRPDDSSVFWYLDAVEEALCFGWIDSIHKEIDGVRMQRFQPLQAGKNFFPWGRE